MGKTALDRLNPGLRSDCPAEASGQNRHHCAGFIPTSGPKITQYQRFQIFMLGDGEQRRDAQTRELTRSMVPGARTQPDSGAHRRGCRCVRPWRCFECGCAGKSTASRPMNADARFLKVPKAVRRHSRVPPKVAEGLAAWRQARGRHARIGDEAPRREGPNRLAFDRAILLLLMRPRARIRRIENECCPSSVLAAQRCFRMSGTRSHRQRGDRLRDVAN